MMKERTTKMQTTNYKGFTVTLSDVDTKKLDKAWKGAKKHWRCIVYDKANRKQMGFDVFGGSMVNMSSPLEALYCFVSDACDFMNVTDVADVMQYIGYEDDYNEAKKVFKRLEKAYYTCRKFIGSDADIREIYDELSEEWG